MECRFLPFTEAVGRFLERSIPVVATIALRGGDFIAEVKERIDVQIVEVARANRQALPGHIAAWIKQTARLTNTP
jgi:nucleoside-triphosphatase THEP1